MSIRKKADQDLFDLMKQCDRGITYNGNPNWTRDSGAALDLAIAEEIQYEFAREGVYAVTHCEVWPYTRTAFAAYKDHPDKATTVRFAVVIAAQEKLKADIQHAREQKERADRIAKDGMVS